jgi:uncharacterized protein YceK
MNKLSNLILLYAIMSVLLLSGCATSSPNAEPAPSASGHQSDATAIKPQASSQEVPRLKIIMSCGSCLAAPTVPELIVQGYNSAAAKAGKSVSSSSEAILSVNHYSQRPPGMRVMFGAFAGRDQIKASVTYKGTTFEVEDYYANAWLGMNSLSNRIGEMAFEKLAE